MAPIKACLGVVLRAAIEVVSVLAICEGGSWSPAPRLRPAQVFVRVERANVRGHCRTDEASFIPTPIHSLGAADRPLPVRTATMNETENANGKC